VENDHEKAIRNIFKKGTRLRKGYNKEIAETTSAAILVGS